MCQKNELSVGQVDQCLTDGAPAMTGCNVGFCAQLEQFLGRTLLKYHCIIHQESLCGKSLQMKDVMLVVVKCVNDIRAAALKREFCQLLNEVDEQFIKFIKLLVMNVL